MERDLTKMWFPEDYVCKYDKNIMRLANIVARKKPGVEPGGKGSIQWGDPEYVILEAVLDDPVAVEVSLGLASFEKRSSKEIAKIVQKDEALTLQKLKDLAVIGVCIWNTVDGEEIFWCGSWIPGIMEIIVNNLDLVAKHPIVGYAMEGYGRVRGPKSSGAFPPGVGLMRVIPIESAIDGNSKACSYEEISKYLDENDLFTVTACSCRTDREVMGEGCGHLKEDMCIQMGWAAEYYIKTGRGRQITRDEAYDIIKKAEDNGLMHQIPNIDGSGKTHAICNCCGCSCLSLRTAAMYKNVDMVRSNYISQVDSEKCVACGQCVENCPVNAIKLGQKLCSSKPVVTDITTKDTPRDLNWEQKYWNVDYRTNRENVVESGTSPCKTACPAHIAVQGYIKLASLGKYKEALELIKNENPLPAICGRICNRRCEDACTRGDLDDPIAIDEIKKFISEQDLDDKNRFIPRIKHDYTDKKIAVIGSGPAGLSCAYFLAVEGYSVTVFEKEEKLGGMLTLGIPSFRLEKNIVDAEIDVIKALGVEFKTGVEVGKDVTLSSLRKEGYKGFYIAIGAQGGRKLGLVGEESEGVISGVEFLRSVNLKNDVKLTGKTVVIGGGNVAIDVSRSAVRCSSDSVLQFCLEQRAEMPAAKEEVEEALGEGIVIENGWGPKQILSKDGKVCGVEFKRCVSVFDKDHRFNPQYDEADTKVVECENVLLSVGQSVVLGSLLEGSKVEVRRGGTLVCDEFTYQTKEGDIFTGGDVQTGPRFAIEAITAGKQGAISLHRFVQPGQSLIFGRDRRDYKELDKESAILKGFDSAKRELPEEKQGVKATTTFKDLRGTFTTEQMQKEASRCLGCGAAIVDEYMCVGCGMCTTKCKFGAVTLKRAYDGEGIEFTKMKPVVVKNMLKRQGKIAIRKVKDAFKK